MKNGRMGYNTVMSAHILLVDDDELFRRSLAYTLEQAGYKISTAGNAENALAVIRRSPIDLVLLDIGLPGMDGLQALRPIKETSTPVIFLTARRRELDEVLGLELGAEDYITKPFDVDILLARIRVVLRRVQNTTLNDHPPSLTVGDLEIDPAAHTLTCDGKSIELTAREFSLLHALALEAGKVIPTAKLLAQVWGAEFHGEPQVVYVHIRWLRQKLEADPNKPTRIVTVRGVGYKLVPRE